MNTALESKSKHFTPKAEVLRIYVDGHFPKVYVKHKSAASHAFWVTALRLLLTHFTFIWVQQVLHTSFCRQSRSNGAFVAFNPCVEYMIESVVSINTAAFVFPHPRGQFYYLLILLVDWLFSISCPQRFLVKSNCSAELSPCGTGKTLIRPIALNWLK